MKSYTYTNDDVKVALNLYHQGDESQLHIVVNVMEKLLKKAVNNHGLELDSDQAEGCRDIFWSIIKNYDTNGTVAFSTYAYVCFARRLGEKQTHKRAILTDALSINAKRNENGKDWTDILGAADPEPNDQLELVKSYLPLLEPRRQLAVGLVLKGYKTEEIGRLLNISPERVRQLHKDAIKKLKSYCQPSAHSGASRQCAVA